MQQNDRTTAIPEMVRGDELGLFAAVIDASYALCSYTREGDKRGLFDARAWPFALIDASYALYTREGDKLGLLLQVLGLFNT